MKRPTMLMIVATCIGIAAMVLPACGSGLVASPAEAKVGGPNGQIVFSHNDPDLGATLTTVNPDGTHAVALHPGEEARWSPDGTKIATDAGDGNAAAIINPDTGAVRLLRSPDPTLTLFCHAWSPDAKRLGCGTFSDDPSRNGIYTIRTSDGRGLTRITSNRAGLDFIGDWSPDGNRLVFLRMDNARPASANSAIFVVDVDGSGLRRISPWASNEDPEVTSVTSGWSPDGRTILFGVNCSLFTVHPDGTALRRIVLRGIDPDPSCALVPSWSPDGSKIAFAMYTGEQGSVNIYTANADGTDVRQLTHEASLETHDGSPDWGPHPVAN